MGVAQVPWKRFPQTEINYSDDFDSVRDGEESEEKK